eukprot:7234418-Pyramimonas_sp.AAC.1
MCFCRGGARPDRAYGATHLRLASETGTCGQTAPAASRVLEDVFLSRDRPSRHSYSPTATCS